MCLPNRLREKDMLSWKVNKMPLTAGLLCLLLVGSAGATYGAVRWDVIGSPTEVINTGRSEVTGSINFFVRGTRNVTGTSLGGAAQIGLLWTNPGMQIDNTTTSGIKLFVSRAFATDLSYISLVENVDVNGKCSGSMTITTESCATPPEGSFLRLEGIRGRIDLSLAVTPGTGLFVQLQSINDPAANQFFPDRVRVAKSFDGMNIAVTSDSLLLCFPVFGRPPPTTSGPLYSIKITEGFARAFVDSDAGNDGVDAKDRTDSGGLSQLERPPRFFPPEPMGAPTNSTRFVIWLEGIPSSVSGVIWPVSSSVSAASGAALYLVTAAFSSTAGTATATYSYEAINQTTVSDVVVETFTVVPVVVLMTGGTTTGDIIAAVTLAPTATAATGACSALQPSATPSRPRFLQVYESDDIATNNPPDDPHKLYARITRCNCYLLFTYVTSTSSYNTGVAVANTTGDTEVFTATNEAPDQIGKVTFYLYDKSAGYIGKYTTAADIKAGQSFVGLVSDMLPTGTTSFSGYIIARAEFQFCHAFAFIADTSFATIAQGYIANVIPDPSIRGVAGVRTAADSGDHTNLTSGEALNN